MAGCYQTHHQGPAADQVDEDYNSMSEIEYNRVTGYGSPYGHQVRVETLSARQLSNRVEIQ